jgi:hypothetical protein
MVVGFNGIRFAEWSRGDVASNDIGEDECALASYDYGGFD